MRCRLFAALFVASLLLRAGFAILRPAWQAPDEFPHFYYAAHIAAEGTLPEFLPEHPYYESFQPPLYYALSAGIVAVTQSVTGRAVSSAEVLEHEPGRLPEMIFVRLFSLILGLAAINAAGRTFSHIFGGSSDAAYVSSALLLFHPSFLSNTTSITNDALAVFIGAVLLLYLVNGRYLERPLAAGVLLALGMLTKSSLLLFFPLYLLFLLCSARPAIERLKTGLLLTAPMLLVLGMLCLFNFNVVRHIFLLPAFSGNEATFTLYRLYQVPGNFFWSFWAAFGRIYEIRPHVLVYVLVFFQVSLLSIAGLVKIFKEKGKSANRETLIKMLAAVALFILASFGFSFLFFGGVNTSWGKNAFPVIAAVIVLFVSGLYKIMGNKAKILILVLSGICFLIDAWALGVFTGLL